MGVEERFENIVNIQCTMIFHYNRIYHHDYFVLVTRDAMGQYLVPPDGKPLTSLGKLRI